MSYFVHINGHKIHYKLLPLTYNFYKRGAQPNFCVLYISDKYLYNLDLYLICTLYLIPISGITVHKLEGNADSCDEAVEAVKNIQSLKLYRLVIGGFLS